MSFLGISWAVVFDANTVNVQYAFLRKYKMYLKSVQKIQIPQMLSNRLCSRAGHFTVKMSLSLTPPDRAIVPETPS